MSADRAARVTGIGCITAFGMGVPAFAAGLRNGSSGIARVRGQVVEMGGFLVDFDFNAHLKILDLPAELHANAAKIGRRAPRSVQCSLLVCLEAWIQAGLTERSSIDPERVSVIVAGQNISQAYQFGMHEKFTASPEYLPPSYGLHFLDTDHVGAVSELLQVRGEGATMGGASASGNVAILHGLRLIRQGLADVCVIVGALADLSPLECQAFQQLGAMGGRNPEISPDQACRPFDAGRDGFIYGQGASCLILERQSGITNRTAANWGLLRGGATCLDANSSSDLNATGVARGMRQALEDAGASLADLQYINAHATSSVQGDQQEIQAIKQLLGSSSANVWINATKELTGHCLWSAGVVEALAVLIQMREGFLHSNPNLVNPIDCECQFVGRIAREIKCRTALSNSFGFGGINTSLLFQGTGD
jgi:malonyl-ACP decarboxylase